MVNYFFNLYHNFIDFLININFQIIILYFSMNFICFISYKFMVINKFIDKINSSFIKINLMNFLIIQE